jgi:hypothetical protein
MLAVCHYRYGYKNHTWEKVELYFPMQAKIKFFELEEFRGRLLVLRKFKESEELRVNLFQGKTFQIRNISEHSFHKTSI